jgi:hypothetical protein
MIRRSRFFGCMLFCGIILAAQTPGTFSATGIMTAARFWHSATLLNDGTVLIAGGVSETPTGLEVTLASAELYDPSSGTFRAVGKMIVARSAHTATLLPNGTVLIAGGDGTPGSAELYDPATATFTATGNMIADGSYFHTATLLPDGAVLLVAQGYYGSGAQVYDPSTGAFAVTGSPYAAPYGLNTATSLPDGRVLIGQESEMEAEVYDPRSGTFSRTWPRIPWVQGSAALLMNGDVLLAGGNDDTGESASAAVYDPSTNGFGPV